MSLKNTKQKIEFYWKRGLFCLKHMGIKKTWHKIKKLVKRKRWMRHLADTLFLSEEQRREQEQHVFGEQHVFSILVPLYNTPLVFLQEMIQSVQDQTYPNWELCLADGSEGDRAKEVQKYCLEQQKKDSRIKYRKLEKNGGISENTNACVEMAEGDYIALFDHDDLLHPAALYEMMVAIGQEQADYLFTDEIVFEGNVRNIVTAHFKSDYAPDTLRSNNYICHFSVFKRSLLAKIGGFRKEFDGSQDHDLILRLTKVAEKIYHIPKILYLWRSHPASAAGDMNAKPYAAIAGRAAVLQDIEREGGKASVDSVEFCPTIYRMKYELQEHSLVSVIIPCREYSKEVKACLESIQGNTTYDNYEIILILGQTTEEKITGNNVKVLHWNRLFVYAEAMAAAVAEAKGSYYVFLHSDVQILSPEWLEEMLMYARRSDVGAVGAKELYKNDTIRNAGVILEEEEGSYIKYSHQGQPGESEGYMGRLKYVQNVSAVQNSCLMIRGEVYEKLSGFSTEFFRLAAPDLCLRLREAGYWIVFTPFARVQHDKIKRNRKTAEETLAEYQQEEKLFAKRWEQELKKGDPFFGWNFKRLEF